MLCAVERGALVAGVGERPRDVCGDAEDVGVEARGCALVDEAGVRAPAAVGLLLGYQPVAGARDDAWVDVGNLAHVVELHQAVGGKDLVGGGLAEPAEAAAADFKREQPLVAVGDVAFGFGMDFGRQLFGALHVIEREHVGVGARRRLLEAAAGHAQDAVHAFDDLAERAGVQAHEERRGVRQGVSGEAERLACARRFPAGRWRRRSRSRPLGTTSISRTTMSRR